MNSIFHLLPIACIAIAFYTSTLYEMIFMVIFGAMPIYKTMLCIEKLSRIKTIDDNNSTSSTIRKIYDDLFDVNHVMLEFYQFKDELLKITRYWVVFIGLEFIFKILGIVLPNIFIILLKISCALIMQYELLFDHTRINFLKMIYKQMAFNIIGQFERREFFENICTFQKELFQKISIF